MPWNGSGSFTRAYNWVTDKINGIKITAARMDGEFDNYKGGLENCLTRDGQNAATSNLPMGGFRHTGVGNATARSNYAAAAQVQDGSLVGGVVGGTGDAITITLTPAIAAYATRMMIAFKAGADNTTSVQVNVNSVGLVDLKQNGVALIAGDILTNDMIIAIYDGTAFQMLQNKPTSRIAANSVGLAKLVQIAAMRVLGNMTGSTANVDVVPVLDEDNMASNSAVSLATQQSIKAYVDGRTTIATQAEAEAGTENTHVMTALRVAEAIAALVGLTIDVQIFSSSGTWTKPIGALFTWGRGKAGGGGGGKPDATGGANSASGGAEGGFFEFFRNASTLAATIAITIGALGAGRTSGTGAGSAGGSTSVSGVASANGGAAGNYNPPSGAAGGTATGGDINITGASSIAAIISTDNPGDGAGTIFGQFGRAKPTTNGQAASGFGCGGAGGGYTANGGNGSIGFCWMITLCKA